jgi:hypothetical protein
MSIGKINIKQIDGILAIDKGGTNNNTFTQSQILIFGTNSIISSGYTFSDGVTSSYGIWSSEKVSNYVLNNTVIGITAGAGLTGGGTAGFITLSLNPLLAGNGLTYSSGVLNIGASAGITISSDFIAVNYTTVASQFAGSGLTSSAGVMSINPTSAGNGLTFSSGSYSVNVNSDSLEIVSDIIRMSTTISNTRIFTGGVTISNNLSVTGSTVLNTLTASNTYISSTASNTLSLYSSGTSSTIFTVSGVSGELFNVTDGLTGSLFSVNDISGLPILEVFSDNTILMGDYAAPSLNTSIKVITITGSNTIYSIPTSLYTGAFFEYTLTSGSNARAGSIMSVWSGNTVSFAELATTDIGTTGVTFSVGISGSNALLIASSSTSNWTIKTIIRSI